MVGRRKTGNLRQALKLMYEAVGKARVQPVSSKVPVLILSTLTGEEAWRGVAWRAVPQ